MDIWCYMSRDSFTAFWNASVLHECIKRRMALWLRIVFQLVHKTGKTERKEQCWGKFWVWALHSQTNFWTNSREPQKTKNIWNLVALCRALLHPQLIKRKFWVKKIGVNNEHSGYLEMHKKVKVGKFFGGRGQYGGGVMPRTTGNTTDIAEWQEDRIAPCSSKARLKMEQWTHRGVFLEAFALCEYRARLRDSRFALIHHISWNLPTRGLSVFLTVSLLTSQQPPPNRGWWIQSALGSRPQPPPFCLVTLQEQAIVPTKNVFQPLRIVYSTFAKDRITFLELFWITDPT